MSTQPSTFSLSNHRAVSSRSRSSFFRFAELSICSPTSLWSVVWSVIGHVKVSLAQTLPRPLLHADSRLFNNPFFSTGDAVKHLTRNQSLSRLDRPTHLHSYRRRLRLADVRNTRDDSNTSNAFADAMFANPHRAQETPVIDDEAEDEEYDVPSAFERRRKRWSNGPIRSSSQVEELYRPILRRSYTDFDTDRKRRRVKSSRGFKRSETPPAQVIRGWSPESSISSEFTSDNS